ncbi:MAG: UbiA family prenyltransferase [Proteobacteria bacterium]|nr:UbiA family prenyltransferase [Pseudomonadota bacterium]
MNLQRLLFQLPKVLRVHQWVKNVLLFVPLFTAHRLADKAVWQKGGLAFLAFSLVASSVYIINDLLDVKSDRLHPRKKNRPFASNAFPLALGIGLVPLLISLGVGLAVWVGQDFVFVLGIYFALTFLYSLWVKRLLLWDVICLASLYTIRIFAGSAASGVPVSKWLLAFSLFIFLSLALAKRVSELKVHQQKKGEVIPGRGYQSIDEEALSNLGAASGYLSVLVFALYVNSSEVTQFYRYAETLWFTCPLILYWISRIWIISNRGHLHDDPIVFALKDKVSYLVLLLTVTVLYLAT